MKNFIKMIVVLEVVTFTQLATAREALLETTIKDIKVTSIAPAVQEQLSKANPEVRKKLDAAIHTGDLFMPQHFSGNAYASDPENKDWDAEAEPLIELDRERWAKQTNGMMIERTVQIGNVISNLFEKKEAYTTRLVCSHIALVSVEQKKESIAMLYRTTSIGTLLQNYGTNSFDFTEEGAGKTYSVRIELEPYSQLVENVIPDDNWATWSYTWPLARMKRFLGDHGVVNISTKEREIEMVKAYQNTIQKIRNSAAKICK
jgi:hypothetical protein